MIGGRQWQQFVGLVDMLRHRMRLKGFLAEPFNGQRTRIAIVEAILKSSDFACAIETGTYRGSTTKYLSRHLPRVVSIETEARYATFAKLRLRQRDNIEFIEGDSSVAMQRVLARVDRSRPLFAYLDAHWGAALPLGHELAALERSGLDYIAVIDDFRVPGDDGYGFDVYPSGTIDAEYVFQAVPRLARLWVPAASSEVETGSLRGTGLVASKGCEPALAELERAGLLRPIPRKG